MDWNGYFRPYVSIAERRRQAQKVIDRLKKSGRTFSSVHIDGRQIAGTFWGKSWCENLESYSDYANRLPRGRTYVRNGSVMDLQITAGHVSALVCGTELYEVEIAIAPLKRKSWKSIKAECAGKIDSAIELLQARLSRAVMEIMTRRDAGLYPTPREISMQCSCPDWAGMCKHVAASMYGIGARLDEQPELLFVLRGVDHMELIGQAPKLRTPGARPGTKLLDPAQLSDIFGIEISPAKRGKRGRARTKD